MLQQGNYVGRKVMAIQILINMNIFISFYYLSNKIDLINNYLYIIQKYG